MKWRPIALVIPLVLAITAACGGGGAAGERGQANREQEPDPGAAPVGVFPLTGMPATDRGRLSRPAVRTGAFHTAILALADCPAL